MNIDSPKADPVAAPRIVAIGELARNVAGFLERSFPVLWVGGEVSNLIRAASGHWYFVLKDRDAQVRCVMFRSRNTNLDWTLRDGDKVEARVLVGLYVPRGEFQLQVEHMRRAGAGALFEEFLRIRAKLEKAGLFDAARKRALPAHPRRIGVVTSTQAAALHDVLATLARRAPHVEVIVFPAPVQGDDAPARLVAAIAAASDHREHADDPGIEVLLVVRGGGSIEDLWAFNDERVAYAIVGSRVPVVSGVGHDTDFTIADFVADLRAPTPTAAAELATPDVEVLMARADRQRLALTRAMQRIADTLAQRIDEASRRLRSPEQRLAFAQQALVAGRRRLERAHADRMAAAEREASALLGRLRAAAPRFDALAVRVHRAEERIESRVIRTFERAERALDGLQRRLTLLDPRNVVERGYAIVTDADGMLVRDTASLRSGARVEVELTRGRFGAAVVDVDGAA